jgi:nicotinamidase-related amidase
MGDAGLDREVSAMAGSLKIDRDRTALVVIDLQKGIASRNTAPHDSASVVANAARLAEAFRANGMPVFLVRVAFSGPDRFNAIADEQWPAPASLPADWSDLVPELKKAGSDVVITKKQWGAFYGTELDLQLRRGGMQTIVLCGIATNYGVESTARFAYEYGYQQIFAENAMSSMSGEMHTASINFVLKRLGRVRSTDEILESLAGS